MWVLGLVVDANIIINMGNTTKKICFRMYGAERHRFFAVYSLLIIWAIYTSYFSFLATLSTG